MSREHKRKAGVTNWRSAHSDNTISHIAIPPLFQSNHLADGMINNSPSSGHAKPYTARRVGKSAPSKGIVTCLARPKGPPPNDALRQLVLQTIVILQPLHNPYRTDVLKSTSTEIATVRCLVTLVRIPDDEGCQMAKWMRSSPSDWPNIPSRVLSQ